MSKYKYRHRETYKGVNIDIKANTALELSKKLNKKHSQIDNTYIDANTPLSTFITMYLEAYKKTSVSPDWYAHLETIARTKIVEYLGNRPIGKIRPVEVQAMLNHQSSLSASYVKKIYDLTCQIWHHAYKNNITTTDYSEDLQLPFGRKQADGRSITDYERDILLQVLQNHRGNLFCKIILYCGCRPGEVRALQWRHVDLINRILHIEQAVKGDGIGAPKTDSGVRDIPIPTVLAKELEPYKASSPFDFVCTQTNGQPHSRDSVRRMWENIKREMNILMGCRVYRNKLVPPYPLATPFKTYYLRHTYCTDLEKAGVPINIACRLMGHSNISVTSKIYTHASDEALEIARSLIESHKDGKANGKNKINSA